MPKPKLDWFKSVFPSAPLRGTVTARSLASIVGQIISTSLASGPVSCLRTRALHSIINQRMFWNNNFSLSIEARDELQFWHNNIAVLTDRSTCFSLSVTRVAYSDASSTG